MRHIRADVHQMGDALPALALSITLEEFADLEEKHHENGLRELGLCPRQETDAEGTDSGDGHQEVLVERVAVGDALPRLMQRLMAYEQIRNEVDEQQLPLGELRVWAVLDEDSDNQEDDGDADKQKLLTKATLLVVVVFM